MHATESDIEKIGSNGPCGIKASCVHSISFV